jgi:hypothetical protein
MLVMKAIFLLAVLATASAETEQEESDLRRLDYVLYDDDDYYEELALARGGGNSRLKVRRILLCGA